jgi:hypothetical protein
VEVDDARPQEIPAADERVGQKRVATLLDRGQQISIEAEQAYAQTQEP